MGGVREIRSATIKVEGSTVVLIDTPGFDGDMSKLATIVDQIEWWLKATYVINKVL
jgi:predicted GTPase